MLSLLSATFSGEQLKKQLKINNMKTYTITFADQVWTNKSEEEVLNFVKIALLHNKDVRKVTIEREK